MDVEGDTLVNLDAVLLLHGYRTGSNFIASVLANNGFGRPAEHFNREWQAVARTLASDELRRSAINVIETASARQIFACKLPLQDFLWLTKAIGDWSDPVGSIVRQFRRCVVVLLGRRDIFLQSVSAWRAQATGEWWRYRGANDFPPVPAYDEGGIYQSYLYMCREEYLWREIFSHSEVSPIRLAYEDIEGRPELLNHLLGEAADNIDPERTSISRSFQVISDNVKQRDELSRVYRDQFVHGLMRSYAS